MKISSDDPKLTAYALGELSAAERVEVERELKNSAELRAAVEEIRATAEMLAKELAGERGVAPGMDAAALLARAGEEKIVPFPRKAVLKTVLMGIAASIAVILTWHFWLREPTGHSFAAQKVPQVPLASTLLVADGKRAYLASNYADAESKLKNALAVDPQNREGAYYLDQVYANKYAEARGREKDQSGVVAFSVGQSVSARGGGNRLTQNGTASGNGVPFLRSPTQPGVNNSGWIGRDSVGRPANFSITGGEGFVNDPSGQAGSAERKVITENRFSAGSYAFSAGNDAQKTSGLGTVVPKDAKADSYNVYSVNSVGYVNGTEILNEGIAPIADDTKTPTTYFRLTSPGDVGGPVALPNVGNPGYSPLVENPFRAARENPLSTFSIDVDTGSYANVRRFLNSNQLPPRDAVRIEELINYFPYRYAPPQGEHPFSVNVESAGCPWNAGHRLLRVALKGKELAPGKRPPSNFVFLIDVSGSMQPSERLPLLKQGLRQLVKRMTESDRVAIVVYASAVGVKLASTSCANKEKILAVIDALEAGGSTNGEGGIREAYRVASENFIKDGVNRVLLCTDGDFNVGVSDQNQLVQMIQEKAKSGVFLTTLGVGTDNYKDALMQKLADEGNGNYHYLDSHEEAQKVLVEQMNANFVTIAKDVKIQIEFNPAQVGAYRLLGYEKRLLRKQDFNDDTKDAGEIGAGHTVTALYEIIPAGAETQPAADGLKYQKTFARPVSLSTPDGNAIDSKEMLTIKLRYKKPDGNKSQLMEFPYTDSGARYGQASGEFRFAAAVASFGMLLRDSQFRGGATFDAVLELAEAAKGDDENGYRAEFINLVKKAQTLKR